MIVTEVAYRVKREPKKEEGRWPLVLKEVADSFHFMHSHYTSEANTVFFTLLHLPNIFNH